MQAANSVKASKRKHKNQNSLKDKQRRVLTINSAIARVKKTPVVETRRKP